MRYMTVCSGIEAPTVAWGPLGWEAVAFSEVDPFPCAVLARHYPDVPNLGDMRTINGADFRGKIDLLVGGTPCQSFSVTGLRRGLSDERGNLALEFVRIADEAAPDFVVWENVLGVLSDRGNAFGCFLAALAGEDAPLEAPGGKWSDAGYVLGPARTIAWRALDAQYFGLAQRRKRVFLVGCPRNGADPRKVLFEFGGGRRDSPPGREAREDIAGTLKGGSGTRGWENGAECTYITQALTASLGAGGADDNRAQAGFYVPQIVGQAMSCKWSKGTSGPAGDEHHNLVCVAIHPHCIGRSPTSGPQGKEYLDDGSAYTLDTKRPQAVAFSQNQNGDVYTNDISGSLSTNSNASGRNTPMLMAFHGSQDPLVSGEVTHPMGRNQGQEVCILQGRDLEYQEEQAYCLTDIGSGGNAHSRRILDGATRVRRLTPRECERLQGFPDDYTAIVYRHGKPAADSPRYKALGNSMAVPVMRWIGKRIAHVRGYH